jgi:hypothetical protein
MSDWGKGVTNNEIGWGQGSSNNIGWGSAYGDSWSGDTDLVGFDPDAVAFFAAIEGAGGTLSPEVKTAWNSFVLREKDNSRYAKIKRLYPYLGGVINAAIIDAITLNSATNNNFVDGDCDALIGVTPDGSTKAMREFDTFPNIFADPSNFQYYTYNLLAPTIGFLYGARKTTAPASRIYVEYTGTTLNSIILNGNGNSVTTTLNNEQSIFVVVTQNGAKTNIQTFLDSVLEDTDNVALQTNLTPLSPAYFAYNINGTFSTFSNQKSACNALFQGMSDSDMVGFDASYKTLLTEIGAI